MATSLCIIEVIIYYQRNNVNLSINGTTEQISFFCGGFSGVWNSTRSVRTSCPSDPRERERERPDLMMIPRKEKERIFAALPISQLGPGWSSLSQGLFQLYIKVQVDI